MTTSETQSLLIEIGCEEIPARFLTQAQNDLGDHIKAAIEELRLFPQQQASVAVSAGERDGAPGSALVGRGSGPGEGARQEVSRLQTFSTPRRLVAYVPAILERQSDKVEEITGPPVKVAVDAAGKYTRAAESFAHKNSATVDDLTRVTTPKGEYLAVKKITKGRSALEVLTEILPGIITGISFPKSMYWTGKSGPRFVRPIRWSLAVLGEGIEAHVVPFEIAGVKSGDFTFGHRAIGQGAVQVTGFKDYVQKLHDLQVELEPEKRLERVRNECKALLEGSGFRVVADNDLEYWIVNSTEWPRGLVGSFDNRYLKLPREILVTVMRDHQKYFAVEDEKGNLQPSFVTLLNVEADPEGIIRRGHERVLTARFSDAEFFWNADQKIPLRYRIPMLEKVTYQAKLGTYADKVRRMEAIAREICSTLEGQGKMSAADTDHTLRAVKLCKCDLTTQMVQEFTELQGVVGGLYAKAQSEPQEVADAIYDHYLPHRADTAVPRSLAGAVVSLADKLDAVVAGFAVGMVPSGSSDPFGLRRAGNALIRTILQMKLPLDLEIITERGLEELMVPVSDLSRAVLAFMRERLRHYLEEVVGLRYDTVRAIFSAAWWREKPLEMEECARDLETIRFSPDFVSLSLSAKRIRNIIEKSARPEDYQGGTLDASRLSAGPELNLYNMQEEVRKEVAAHKIGRRYRSALGAIATLRPSVDLFFEKVLVMAEDPAIRRNRIQLLLGLHRLFTDIADLSEIECSL